MDDGFDEPGALTAGMRLGRYELLVAIARGGMARVWAARQHGQRGFTKLVAIKTILPHLAREQEFERMFLDEARIASNVHHPNVCDTYELGEESGVLYLAMEWVNGDSLSRVIRPSGPETYPLDTRVVARIVADACAGLHAAHELVGEDGTPLHVVHRDFSPHNILVSADGNVKVADFGVAKALGQLHEHTSAGQIKGKLAYMAPEQVAGIADRRSDVFSAGCVLYEATLGIAPFRADNDLQTMQNLMAGAYVRPAQRAPGYPAELERIVMTALAADSRQRFQTAEQLRVALEEWLARSGPVVTQANVAQALRARIGERIDRRRDRIRSAQAQSTPDLREDLSGMTPSARGGPRSVSASGVQQVMLRGDQSQSSHPGALGYSQPSHPSQLGQGGYSQPSHPSQLGQVGYSQPSHPSQVGQLGQLGAGGQGLPPATSTEEPNYNLIGGIAIGVIFATLLGGGAYFFLQKGRSSVGNVDTPTVVVPKADPSAAMGVDAGATAVGPAATVVVDAGGVASPSASVAAEIELPETVMLDLDVNPTTATLSVDGQTASTVGAGTKIPKPQVGKPVTLTFRAEGYDDATLKIDEKTPTPVKVSLKRRPRAPVAPAIPTSPY